MSKDTGGPAFPRQYSITGLGEILQAQQGMTLRDWFAGQALTGLMGDPGMRPSSTAEFEHMAWRLYAAADAMIAERNKL